MCDPKTPRAYCCTQPNWIGSSRIWNNYIIFCGKEKIGRKVFSREDIFAGRYFRVNSIFAKISSRENISNSLFAKISSRENKVLYSI